MLTIRLLTLALGLGTPACSTDAATAVMAAPSSSERSELSQLTTLSGFVELYADEPVYLLTNGIEVPLVGATDLLVRLGGLRVTVSGRYLSTGFFQVDAVNPNAGPSA
jgi:hypothetical protein